MTFQDDDEIVISGIGGKFPDAENVAELAEKLFAGQSLLTKDERILTKGFYENLPEYSGKTQNNSILFDNTFFGISPIVSQAMDPSTCQILQRTFEAVIDAGINPSELRGTNAAVFSGTCFSDSDLEWATDCRSGYGIMGRNRCMNSNRISYWLDLNGTSVSTEGGWNNGLSNLFLGWDAIKSGRCDTALVSTATLQENALITMQLRDIGFLSPDGISRTFDDAANGTGRASAVVVFVLQRARFARRKYATIGHIYFTCFGDREEVYQKPSQRDWEKLFRDFYEKAKIDVKDIHYIEAHGSSSKEDDAEELNAITEVFCKDRKTPLLVGCVKSNMGNTEAAAGFCGIVKSIIALENSLIPQNLHYKNPNSLCPGLIKGQIKVVDKNTPINPDGWIAVNCHGYGGCYGHVVLKANSKCKKLKYDNIPRLVLLADRTSDYIAKLLEKVESVPFDLEFTGLLHEIHSRRVEKYLARGYTILPKGENSIHEHQAYGEDKRPVWFIFSGMGSQWPKMGRRLMDLPLFRESIERSHRLLEQKGLDLIHIITTENPNIFDNILHSFVGIAAIQVALVDVLRALNIVPDGFIGHSVGELGCAYADNCFTAEQMVLAAYYRGKASTETDLIKGSMAAVGKGYNEIKDKLPDGVEVACHNSEDSCTLSGPVELIHKYVAELKEQGIFARSVNVSNIAYHSRYIKPAAPKLLAYLKEVVKNPKLRSSKWISTSNPESKWDTDVARYCSAEYHTNNLLSSVLFEEGSKHIPKNAICIEVAPHGLLQAILKRSLGENVTNIPLTSRTADDPLMFLLQAIGKMYMAGIDPTIVNLYPKLELPVSRGTHVLHHLVHWHELLSVSAVTPMERKTVYSLKSRLVTSADDGMGYILNQRNIYPMAIFLELAWDMFASSQKIPTKGCPVVFENFRIEQPIPVHLTEEDNVEILFAMGSGSFEIIITDQLIATGTVSLLKEKLVDCSSGQVKKADLVGDEIYTEIKRKGYTVGDRFKNLAAVSLGENELVAEILPKSNIVHVIESLMQMYILNGECSADFVRFPKSFLRLELSVEEHYNHRKYLGEDKNLTATYDVTTNTITCGGIKLKGLSSVVVEKPKSGLKFPSINFFPLMNPPLKSSFRFADFCFCVVLDNMGAVKNFTVINVMEVSESNETSSVGTYLQQLFCDFKVKLKVVTSLAAEMKDVMDFIISPLSSLERCIDHLVDGGFVFVKSKPGKNIPPGFKLIGKFEQSSNEAYLLLKMEKSVRKDADFVIMEGSQAELVSTLRELRPSDKDTYVICYKEPAEGIGNFRDRMQKETTIKLRWIFILDPKAPKFDIKNLIYAEQLERGLSINIYKNGYWGSYCEYNFSENSFQDQMSLCLEWSDEITPSFISFDPAENVLRLNQVEYSGTINNTRVMGISKLGKSKKLVVDKYLTWEVPDSWSLEDAVTAPMSYALAYYCIMLSGKMKVKKEESILVTDGLTCLGQASIAVALKNASRVFVTVNDEKEAALIKKLFPQLNEKDILCHEDPQFCVNWQLLVKNENADTIMDMLDGRHFSSVLDCIAEYGRFFHFGKTLAERNTQLGSSVFLLSVSFENHSPDSIARLPEEDKKTIHNLISEGLKNGVVRPLPKLVVPFGDLKKIKSGPANSQIRVKTVVPVNTAKLNTNYMRFDTNSSYVVIGDATDIWIDVTKWLVDRNLQNIFVSYQDHTKRTKLVIPYLKKEKGVFLFNDKDVPTLLKEAEKSAPISAVYYISTTSSDVGESLLALDKSYKNPKSFLLAITKSQGRISELCTARNNSGFPSTNFVWDADEMIINEHLEFMGKLCGRDPVVNVSPLTTVSTSGRKLADLLPSTVDDFCDLGSSLQADVRITPLTTLNGSDKEVSPFIFVPGLQKEPVKMVQSIARTLMYPAYCVQVASMELSMPQMASYILSEVIKLNKGKIFNIVGISWGTHLAVELAKVLEDIGGTAGVILIEGPYPNARALVVKSLESDLLNTIKGFSKSNTHLVVENEVISEKTWQVPLHKTLNLLNLPPEKEGDFFKAATFIYNKMRALLNHDISAVNLKGPLHILATGEESFDDKVIWKLSKSLSIRSLPGKSEELLTSSKLGEILNGSAVSRAMSKGTIRECSWQAVEEYTSEYITFKHAQSLPNTNLKFIFMR